VKESEILGKVRELFDDQRLAVLATVSDGQPHCDIVAFAHSEDLRRLFFATMRDTHKYQSLTQHPEVSMLVDSRGNKPSDLERAVAVTIDGVARDLVGQKPDFVELFASKHPTLVGFISQTGCALVCVDVKRYKFVSRFQDVQIIELGY
jgi:nitroimidazol reductase NimA-like FMN-containing flavoprotein (pyridoxamine 5'-phosphate oxidase superfamily)